MKHRLAALAVLAAALFGAHTSTSHAAVTVPSGSCVTSISPQGYPAVSCREKTWHCTSEQRHTQVNVKVDSPDDKIDAVHLDAGCTGTIRLRIETNSGDGVKIHTGAHDLTLYFGQPAKFGTRSPAEGAKVGILCTGKHGDVHQDGIQAMGGENVNIVAPNIECPTGNNGGLFCNGGRGGNGVPTNIVVRGGFVYEGNAAIHVGPNSSGCGAVGVVLKTDRSKASPDNCIRVDHAATDPVDDQNVCTTPK